MAYCYVAVRLYVRGVYGPYFLDTHLLWSMEKGFRSSNAEAFGMSVYDFLFNPETI